MADSDEDIQAIAQEFQTLQQQLQVVMIQKQQTAVQEQELVKALEEVGRLKEGRQAYRLVGSVFVPKDKAALEKELKDESEALQVRKAALEKQEARLAERLEAVRKKAEKMQKGEGAGNGG